MPHHTSQLYVHLVWHVHAGSSAIPDDVQAWLWPAIAVKARELGCSHLAVGGAANHVHVIAMLPPTLAVANLAQRLKGASSRALHLKGCDDFAWQEGYGAFSVSPDHVPTVTRYVQNQPQHHAQASAKAAMQ